jgi:hypothetical protein
VFTTFLLQQVQRRSEQTQGREEKKDGTSQLFPGTPIVTVTIGHPVLFEVYAQVDDYKKETYSSNAVTISYKNMISDILMTHGQVLIWQARDDERYMHALRFEKKNRKKIRIVYSVCLSCSGGWLVEANTTLMDQTMAIQWIIRDNVKVFLELVILKQLYLGTCR